MDNQSTVHEVGNDTNCPKTVPDAVFYFANMSTLMFAFTIVAIVLTVIMIIIYIFKLYFVFKYVSNYTHRPGKLAWLAAIYPYTAIGCLIGICVPRSITITEIFVLLYQARCMFLYIELMIDYFGSRLDMATQLVGQKVHLNIKPLCKCCICCPVFDPTVKNIQYIELLVYQVAIIRPLLFLVNGVAYSDNYYKQAFSMTITVLNLVSTFTAMYGFMVLANFCSRPLRHYRINVWMKLAQCVIMMFNLQGPIFNLVATFKGIPCTDLLPIVARAAIWNNYLLIFEMFILSIISAWMLRPTMNAVFDKHPFHRTLDGPRRKGTIKPKASVRYYQTEPTAGQKYRPRLDAAEAVGGLLPTSLEDDDLENGLGENKSLVVPLLK